MKVKPEATVASLLPSLNGFFSRKNKEKKPAPNQPAYQPTVEDLQNQVTYYKNHLAKNDSPGLTRLSRENPQILSMILALPESQNITQANQTEVREQLVALSDVLVAQQLTSVEKTTEELCLLNISELSPNAIKQLKALPNLAYLQINHSALVTLPKEFANLNLNKVYLQNNHFKQHPAVLDECKNRHGKPMIYDLSLNDIAQSQTNLQKRTAAVSY